MNSEAKMQDLQERIWRLSKDLGASLQELRMLQAELDVLKGNAAPISAEKESVVHTSVEPTHGSLENFIGLKLIHLVGIVVLVAGISIGVKYAIDKELISEAMRITLAYAAGALLFLLSWRLKKKYLLFSAILFSGSMATFYFTTYASFVYYQFFPAIVSFLLMVAFTVYTVVAAVSYNRQEIALLGMIGAYGIPFLVSANSERVDLFFSYILLINAGIVFLSFRKSWKIMGQAALYITWLLFIGWAFFRYDGREQWIAFLFILLYFFLFTLSALALRIRRKEGLTSGAIQQVLVNNSALYLAAVLIFSNDFDTQRMAAITGFSFLFLSFFAMVVWWAFSSEIILQRLLAWQSLVLLILFISFQWEGLTVTLLWIAVSILLFAWGIWNKKAWQRLGSVLLIGITLAKLIIFDSAQFSTVQRILSFILIGVLLLSGSFYYQRFNLSQKNKNAKR